MAVSVHRVPRTMMKMEEWWGSADRCRWVQTAASWSSSRCRRHRRRRRRRRGSVMARKWWNRRIWLIDFVDFARLCVSLLVLFVGFFGNFLRSRTIGESIQIYVLFSLYIWYISLLYCFSLSYSISRPITRTYPPLSLIVLLSPFSLSERKMYLHKSFTFTLVTLNCICFTSIDERSLSSRSQSSGFLARYLLFADACVL